MEKILLLALAGACGTVLRYWLSGLAHKILGPDFPWGTMTVNITGCFLFGLFWVLAFERGLVSGQARIIILVGFMGAFTTFSTYIFESSALIQDVQWIKLGLNLMGQNILGFGALYLGYICARIF
ncbi:fluoride efflux transporter CrcB [Desulfonatronovibrio magnus]|uniref:fluoride efflux transporter CrcB n=1 Tax=Desulfonatronovibrio magnus TaxID=698827 RepID=UPI0018DE3AD8|nr:fluoride efflux transporter CrcB [Desulfonatronovibrio magnus]